MESLFCFMYIWNMNHTKSYTLTEATKKMERYCAYQERCHQEVSKKLNELGVFGTQIDTIISHLIEQNYLNETRFAEQFIHGKFNIKKFSLKHLI